MKNGIILLIALAMLVGTCSGSIDLAIEGETQYSGFQCDLVYDETMIEVISVGKGEALLGQEVFFNSGAASPGLISNIYCSSIGEGSYLPEGPLLSVEYRTLNKTGYATIELTNIVLSDMNGSNVQSSPAHHTILIDRPPVVEQVGDVTVTDGTFLQIGFNVTDPDGDPVYIWVEAPFTGYTVVGNLFTWTAQEGTWNVTLLVSDSYLEVREYFTITVLPSTPGPSLPEDPMVFEEGKYLNINVTAPEGYQQYMNSEPIGDSVYLDYDSAGNAIISVVSPETDALNATIVIQDVHPRYDINEDGVVNIYDIVLISQKYSVEYPIETVTYNYSGYGMSVELSTEGPTPRVDVNQDGVVNIFDLTLTAQKFGDYL